MSRKKDRGFNQVLGTELDKFQSLVSAPVSNNATTANDAPNFGRFWFLSQSTPGPEKFATFCEAATQRWVVGYEGYWNDLAIRHRAIQLALTLEGQEFVRWLAVTNLDQPLGEHASYFTANSVQWFSPLNAESSFMDLARRYIMKKTSLGDCNGHVYRRDLATWIPSNDRVPATDVLMADEFYQVSHETVAELQVWASNSMLRGSELFLHPGLLDTKDLLVERIRSATADQARALQPNTFEEYGRPGLQMQATLIRRARLSRHAFFEQVTKRGLDHERNWR